MANQITNTSDIIDSRDVIERIDALTIDGDLNDDERDELEALRALAEEVKNYVADWIYGATLISDDHFVAYAQQLAEDIGAIDPHAGWPLDSIDWEDAAEDLQMDYTPVDFDGATYWVR